MKYFIVSFNRQSAKRYGGFHSEFVAHSGIKRWCHYLASSYLIGTNITAKEVSNHFRAIARKHGLPTRHIVLRVDLQDRSGWMPSGAWEWIRKQLAVRG